MITRPLIADLEALVNAQRARDLVAELVDKAAGDTQVWQDALKIDFVGVQNIRLAQPSHPALRHLRDRMARRLMEELIEVQTELYQAELAARKKVGLP